MDLCVPACSAFPVPAVPPIPGGSDSSGSTASHPIAAPAVAKSAAAATSAPATSFSKGDLVWYQDRDGSWLAVKVGTAEIVKGAETQTYLSMMHRLFA